MTLKRLRYHRRQVLEPDEENIAEWAPTHPVSSQEVLDYSLNNAPLIGSMELAGEDSTMGSFAICRKVGVFPEVPQVSGAAVVCDIAPDPYWDLDEVFQGFNTIQVMFSLFLENLKEFCGRMLSLDSGLPACLSH
jgi:hypothetical protein